MIKLSDIKLGDKLELKADSAWQAKWWPCTVQRITSYLAGGREQVSITVGWDSPRCRSTTIDGQDVENFLRKPCSDPGSLVGGVAMATVISHAQAAMIKDLETRLEVNRKHNDELRKQAVDARGDLHIARDNYAKLLAERNAACTSIREEMSMMRASLERELHEARAMCGNLERQCQRLSQFTDPGLADNYAFVNVAITYSHRDACRRAAIEMIKMARVGDAFDGQPPARLKFCVPLDERAQMVLRSLVGGDVEKITAHRDELQAKVDRQGTELGELRKVVAAVREQVKVQS